MLGTTFYHGIIRNLIVAFGTLFNNIEITRRVSTGAVSYTHLTLPTILLV